MNNIISDWKQFLLVDSIFDAIWSVTLLQLCALCSYLFLLLFGDICILLSVIAVMEAYLFVIKQSQVVALLCSHQAVTWRHMTKFCITERQIFLLFDSMNRIYGDAFLVFLILNCPSSVMFLSMILLGQLCSLLAVYFVLMYFMHQMSCIFGMHLVATQYSHRLHLPSRRLAQLMVGKVFPSLRTKLKVVHFVLAFHVKKRYGANYGKSLGLISLAAFAKVSTLAVILCSCLIFVTHFTVFDDLLQIAHVHLCSLQMIYRLQFEKSHFG